MRKSYTEYIINREFNVIYQLSREHIEMNPDKSAVAVFGGIKVKGIEKSLTTYWGCESNNSEFDKIVSGQAALIV